MGDCSLTRWGVTLQADDAHFPFDRDLGAQGFGEVLEPLQNIISHVALGQHWPSALWYGASKAYVYRIELDLFELFRFIMAHADHALPEHSIGGEAAFA